ncbi:acetoacetyl-CoA synthetase [Desulfotomaculum arcticum]|uniref:Acetoacetyl-CoA synthetase n=1 Tax=Desulfotruncus arcticus DSM 17038 TaxID=1121424 RepID=A0A1I2TDV2_9FIRM|nr:acetoacetate--CoA ligase [Desulfotruncus arcticus]SFG63113.1 acetoacetyl-CoA synthetase [Desulfotomaculum arcticum] [Desulfotruncus arcticus DSM 17038]
MNNLLWSPSEKQVSEANITAFIRFVNEKYGKNFNSYSELYDWSITDIPDFWATMWEFCGIRFSKPYFQVVDNLDNMLEAKWFAGAKLNFAKNLLRYRDDQTALIFKSEALEPVRITYTQLYDRVARLARSLRDMGIKTGDRVAGFMPNMIETVIAMLATTSIGAIWSSCSPDFGIKGVLDRFGQIGPRVLFTANGYYYNGKAHDSLTRIPGVLKDISSIQKVVVVPYTEEKPNISHVPNSVYFDNFISKESGLEIEFEQLPFDHPLYIMYSSGTTGIPKCIMHSAGGTLMQHLKELLLHTNLKREDKMFYFTTCGWMMWNWLVSSLAVGATILLFDGSPFYPDSGTLFKLAQDEKITVFGTSAKYLAAVEKNGIKPGREYDLSNLRAFLSTGSPLSIESFEFVYKDIKKDLRLSSISGGTDIISCFALGNPIGSVYAGELQCRGLGMKVEAFDLNGKHVFNQKGELVCTAPFPSQPIGFWDDPDQKKYKSAYFDVYDNVWHHGDYIEINDKTGGVVIYGRSDATLNPGGVRIGTAEIYRQVETLPEVLDSLVVGQEWDNDVRVVLYVKLAESVELTDELMKKIKTVIRVNTTPRHVPAKIVSIKDIPYTISGKKVELAVRNLIHGQPVLNKDALANPEALEYYKDIPELQN